MTEIFTNRSEQPDDANRDYTPEELRAFAAEAHDEVEAQIYENAAKSRELEIGNSTANKAELGSVAVKFVESTPQEVIVDHELGTMSLDTDVTRTTDGTPEGQFNLPFDTEYQDWLAESEDYKKAKDGLASARAAEAAAAESGDELNRVFWASKAEEWQTYVDEFEEAARK